MPLRPRAGDSTLEVGKGAGLKGFNRARGGKVLRVGNPWEYVDACVELVELVLVVLCACLELSWLWWALTFWSGRCRCSPDNHYTAGWQKVTYAA